MTRFKFCCFACLAFVLGFGHAIAQDFPRSGADETRYLSFQLMTGLQGYAGPPPPAGRSSLGKSQLESFVKEVSRAIGTTGDARQKLCFAVGPLCFDMTDDETRLCIREAFEVARENDVAVAFHIDDSMMWSRRTDLVADPDNIETSGWNEKPSTGRRADWGPQPTKFPPQMCFNSPGITAAVKERGRLIGEAIQNELASLKSQGKSHLFACVIAGWETQIGSDFETNRPLGYRALAHRGFNQANPPKDPDLERAQVVKEFMELWANSLHEGGVPRPQIFCHIAFTDQGLKKGDAKESHAEKVHFAIPDVAFSPAYRPGFSTYPEGATFKEVYKAVEQHGSPGWISAEGANVSPTSMPGEPTMESYLARMFNHGAVMTNIFSWGIGGEKMRDHFFRKATENPEALASYAKFLRSEKLTESTTGGFSSEAFQSKMRRIQDTLPAWVQQSGQQAKAMPLMQKLDGHIKSKKWLEADKTANDVLALMKDEATQAAAAADDDTPVQERLPKKLEKIQSGLEAWVNGKPNRAKQATELMQSLDKQIKATELEEADKTADKIIELLATNPPDDPSASGLDDESRKHILHELGSPFILSRKAVREALKLSDEQQQKLDTTMTSMALDSREVIGKLNQKPATEREKVMNAHREQARAKFLPRVKETLNSDQYARFEQLILQHESPGCFGRPDVQKKLDFTQSQRMQLVEAVQEMQKKIEPLIKQAKSGGNPKEILPKVIQFRHDCEEKIVDFLTDEQKKKWIELRGDPVDVLHE